ncbi:930_t:CDS:2 [Dentiscutata erythropus]|uniref:930_t:CDS:1 n=1 Tax=Dentiscutata erythropus TaxID=1348616 RepID=A0A9N9ATG1_9GLOM|nr:930_t:CDS:2 [Dentiscutata erythropus]
MGLNNNDLLIQIHSNKREAFGDENFSILLLHIGKPGFDILLFSVLIFMNTSLLCQGGSFFWIIILKIILFATLLTLFQAH